MIHLGIRTEKYNEMKLNARAMDDTRYASVYVPCFLLERIEIVDSLGWIRIEYDTISSKAFRDKLMLEISQDFLLSFFKIYFL